MRQGSTLSWVGGTGRVFNTHRRNTRQEFHPVTAHSLITDPADHVNDELTSMLQDRVVALFVAEDLSGRKLEQAVWEVVLEVGRQLLSALLTWSCWKVMKRESGGRAVRLRLDTDYTLSQATTFGTVCVPLFAWREHGSTHAPARTEVFPLHPKVRSSELLLEWETRLGCQLPFRQAEDGLAFFSHGAVQLEDTTIARHLRVVGPSLEQLWTCRSPEKVAVLLEKRATRDRETGRPLLYVSTDAHALRRYVDDTWKAEYKMLNGIRLWCIDQNTGQTVHLGGEYTWGDCREVARRTKALVDHLVPTGDATPQLVCITDGMPWIRDHVYPVLPPDTCFILDFYHLSERLSEYANATFGLKTQAAQAWVRRVVTDLTGKRPYKKAKVRKRSGHQKKRGRRRNPFRTVHPSANPHGPGEQLLWMLAEENDSDARTKLLGYVGANLDRIDFSVYRRRGMQIGSGAMESLHRTASQMRLKLAGARWRPEMAIAVLNARLMLLAERWEDFWAQPDLAGALTTAFNVQAVAA